MKKWIIVLGFFSLLFDLIVSNFYLLADISFVLLFAWLLLFYFKYDVNLIFVFAAGLLADVYSFSVFGSRPLAFSLGSLLLFIITNYLNFYTTRKRESVIFAGFVLTNLVFIAIQETLNFDWSSQRAIVSGAISTIVAFIFIRIIKLDRDLDV